MEDSNSVPYTLSQHSPSDNASAHVTSAPQRVTDGGSSSGSINGAKYKLLSPAKLPISRSSSITVPPGLSPTSLLESPVLLSNIKAEPSPTTGSFFKPLFMRNSDKTGALSMEKSCSSGNNVDGKASRSSFEFKCHTGSTSASGLSSVTIPAGLNRNGSVSQVQDQCFPQSSVATYEQLSLEEWKISTPMDMPDLPACSMVDELNQGGHSHSSIPVSSSEQKDSISSTAADRTSDDGYNWRKYGQKVVKGSEFPRSYYKCTYPNCEVKKIFERSPSGQITEIVYKGSHDHPKPQATRRHNPVALMSAQDEKMEQAFSSFTGQDDKLNTNSMEPNVSPVLSPLQAKEEGIAGSGSQIQGANEDIGEDDPFSKRRKMEDGFDLAPVVKPIREPRVVVQTVSEVDILDDGYRWRKYGQKVVRGNPNPRSYYKCTNAGCPVRKHVERASHDPKSVITTYEGKHNHDLPTSRNASHEFAGTALYSGTSNIGAEQSGSISLDLGVGVGRFAGNRTNEQAHPLDASRIPASHSIVNGDLNLYESKQNLVQGRGLQTPSVHPSNQYPPNLGRILNGPQQSS